MSARTLPPNPNLDQLKKQAKTLLKAHRAGDAQAIARLRASVPRLADASDDEIRAAKFALLDAQAVVAREYGFEHWQALEVHVAGEGREFTPELRQILKAVDDVDPVTVATMLKAHPHLATATVYDEDVHGETLLHRAMPGSGVETTQGHLEIAELMLDHGADPNAIGWGNNNPASPPLMIAAWGGNTPMVELLLTRGADPNLPGEEGMGLPIDTAASHGYPETVEILIDHGAEFQLQHLIEAGLDERAIAMLDADPKLLEQPDTNARKPLHIAVEKNGRLLRELLDRGVDIQAVDARGWTALHQAIERDNNYGDAKKTVRLLLDRGAELDIWAAAGLGDFNSVASLLDANPQLADAPLRDESTPICWAAHQGDPRTIQLLIGHGVELNQRGWPRSIPLFAALRHGHEEAARLMLEAGVDPNLEGDGWQNTALFTAARWGSPSTVALLLDYGADINAGKKGQQSIGHGGLGWAAWAGKTEVVQLLIDRGVDLHHPNHHYIPHAAAGKGNNEVIELLARHGADLNRKDPTGQTPLAVALFRGHDDTAELLRSLGAIE